MALLKYFTLSEQNANTLSGAQVTSATYVGTNTVADLTIRVGREASNIDIVGTQTASRVFIALDTFNAFHGATVVISRNTQTVGTSIIDLYSGAAGTGYATGTSIATGTGPVVLIAAFDGVAQVWR